MGWEASSERMYPEDGALKGEINLMQHSLIIFPSHYYSPAFTKGEKVDLNTKRTKKSQHTSEGTYIHFQISGVTNTEKLPTPIELPLKVKVHGKDSPLNMAKVR
uniref:Toxic shock syndrome toxin n=1 Tax=Staphylococcus aureus TaxID=1280 RepID=A0A0P0UVZ8_STAAU|nr:toxic shock syndrome toxin [Staphylococcus aureus]